MARFVGIDGLRLLSEVGISPTELDDPSARLPAAAAVRLLEMSADRSKCDSFGLRMAQCRSFASLGPTSLLLERVENVGEVLATMSSFRRTLSDVFFVAAETIGDSTTAAFDVIPPFGLQQAVDMTIGLGYMSLVGASGGRWVPEAVHFKHGKPEDCENFASFFKAPLAFNSGFNGFSFPAESMYIALPLADRGMADNVRRLLQGITQPAAHSPALDHAKQSLALLLGAGRGTLADVARNLSSNPRALQRQLRSEGRTFAGLLNDVRRELAQRQMAGSDQDLTAISESLGYSNLSSFTRWFGCEFGMSPSAWRTKQRAATLRSRA